MNNNVVNMRFGSAPHPASTLSPREQEVLRLIAQGLSNQEISEAMFLGINTVKTYIRGAYRKIDVASRTQALIWVLNSDLVATEAGETSETSETSVASRQSDETA